MTYILGRQAIKQGDELRNANFNFVFKTNFGPTRMERSSADGLQFAFDTKKIVIPTSHLKVRPESDINDIYPITLHLSDSPRQYENKICKK